MDNAMKYVTVTNTNDLKILMKLAKVKQTDLCRVLKLTRQRINILLNGRLNDLSLDQFETIMSYLGYSLNHTGIRSK